MRADGNVGRVGTSPQFVTTIAFILIVVPDNETLTSPSILTFLFCSTSLFDVLKLPLALLARGSPNWLPFMILAFILLNCVFPLGLSSYLLTTSLIRPPFAPLFTPFFL